MKKNLFFAGLGLASSCITVDAVPSNEKILDMPLAGSWYEADPVRLKKQIRHWFQIARLPDGLMKKTPLAVISPHAGYAYSGPTAAYGYKTLLGRKYDRVIIIGPSHRVYMKNQICIPSADGIRTPLGIVPTDQDALRRLGGQGFVRISDQIHYDEHSVQIQLPFLQCALDSPFKIVPVITGQLDADAAAKTAKVLASLLTPSALVVISSDFTHYGRDFGYVPFRDNIGENLRKLDLGAFEKIQTGKADLFARYIEETGATICGEGPIRILLEMLQGQAGFFLLHYANSADDSKDYSHCVSYVSALVADSRPSAAKTDVQDKDSLPESDRRILLQMARDSIEYVFKNRKRTPPASFADRATETMKRDMGCFVTLKIGNELRGCIGEIEPFRPLYKAVTDRAVDSAFCDPRFPQLSPEEFRRVEIEISALQVLLVTQR